MSEPIPESVPTSQDPRSKRPVKRRALTPVSQQATHVDALFAKPDKEVSIPPSSVVSKKSALPPPPEIVANVQGSSAGAGSGEFHVYKASRRREYERLRIMDDEVAREQADADFEKNRLEQKKKDEERTEKNRKKREKRQKRGGKAQGGTEDKDGIMDGVEKSATKNGEDKAKHKSKDVENGTLPATTAEDVGVIIHVED